MPSNNNFQYLPVTVESCPKCSKPHNYVVKATIDEEKPPIFGGPGDKTEVGLTCPQTSSVFVYSLDNPENGEIVGVATDEEKKAETQNAEPKNVNAEYKEWSKQSRDKALMFCSTMLNTSTGAIGIYFAIQKYLGAEKINLNFAILPPILFLISSIVFIIALRPQYTEIAEKDFNEYRKKRLKRLNFLIKAGIICFILSTLLSILIFTFSLK